MNATPAQPTLAQISAVCESTARYMNTRVTCHAAAATHTLNMAMLVREKRVSAITIEKVINTAVVAAGGIEYGEKCYDCIFILSTKNNNITDVFVHSLSRSW